MKKIVLSSIISIVCFWGANAQIADTLRIDANTIHYPQEISPMKSQKYYVLDARQPFVLMSKTSFDQYQRDSLTIRDLISAYERKDALRRKNITGLNQYYEELLREYQTMSKKMETSINLTNGQLQAVQGNLKSAKSEIQTAQNGIVQAQSNISKANNNIDLARNDINRAIGKLESAKRRNSLVILILSGIAGGLLGYIIAK